MSDSFKTAAICIGAGVGVAVLTRYIQSWQDQLKDSPAQNATFTPFPIQVHAAASRPVPVHQAEPVVSHTDKVADIEDVPEQILRSKYYKLFTSGCMERCHSDASASTQATTADIAPPMEEVLEPNKTAFQAHPAPEAVSDVFTFSKYYEANFKAPDMVVMDNLYARFTKPVPFSEVHQVHDNESGATAEFVAEWADKDMSWYIPRPSEVRFQALALAIREGTPERAQELYMMLVHDKTAQVAEQAALFRQFAKAKKDREDQQLRQRPEQGKAPQADMMGNRRSWICCRRRLRDSALPGNTVVTALQPAAAVSQ